MFLVSIIIPVYNVEIYLRRCLDSVVRQSYPYIEIIIVNDGSPDNSQAIINEYAAKDERIKVVQQENRGVSEARNAGMSLARGEYLAFVDSDDYLETDGVQLLLDNAVATKSHIVAGNRKILHTDGRTTEGMNFSSKVLSLREMEQVNQRFDYFIGQRYQVAVWGKLFEHNFIKSIGLQFESASEIFAEDMLFSLKCYVNQPRISLLNEHVYVYCLQENSITRSYKPGLSGRYLSLAENFRSYLAERQQVNEYQDLLDIICFNVMSVTCSNAYRFAPRPYSEIKREIKYLLQAEIIKKMAADFARGDYIRDIHDGKWKMFAFLYSRALHHNLVDLAVWMQLVRFKLFNNYAE